MAPPPTSGPGVLQRRLFQAAADDDLQLVTRTATVLDMGKGHLREAVEAVKGCGAGALHISTGRGRMSVCAYLIQELLVDVNASDDLGDTPLAYAVRSGTLDIVQYLLDHDASPDKPNGKGSTSPFSCCRRMQRPGWAKACYLQGAAQMLLKDYEKACNALDPANVEIEKALWEAINCLKTSHAAK